MGSLTLSCVTSEKA